MGKESSGLASERPVKSAHVRYVRSSEKELSMARLMVLLLVTLVGGSVAAVSAQQATPVAPTLVPEKYIVIEEPRPGIFTMVEEEPTDDNDGIVVRNATSVAHRIEVYLDRELLVRSTVNPDDDFYYALQTPGRYEIVCLTHDDSIEVQIDF
jgi:hypothetical protein